jgi:hypothetical protein
MRYACSEGFEHHVAVNPTEVARAVVEALATYKGWDVYHHNA